VTRRLLLSYLVLTLGVLIALGLPLGILNAHNLRQDLRSKVQRDAVTLGSLAEDALEHKRPADPNVRIAVNRYAEETDAQVVVREASGRVVVDSARAAEDEAEHAGGGLLVTTPIAANGRVFGTVAITYPTASTDHRIVRDWVWLSVAAAVVLAAAALLGLLLSRSVSRPLRRVERAAQRIGDGELDARAPETDGPDDVRRLARTLNETAAKLETLVRSQEDFVADASHQLRTPLTALRLRLENLERDVAPPGRETLAAALTEADRLSRLVSELLALARPQDQVEPADAVDVAALAAARAEAWDALVAERDLRIETAGAAARARAGAGRVEQVLDNLLANAVEASPPGSTIRLSSGRRDGWIELHVVDEGPGLSADARARAFDRFWHAGPGEGSGLGLAIARRLVEVDEGEIALHEASAGGVDAVVRLRPTD
jgi:signal transduction histidine kinase